MGAKHHYVSRFHLRQFTDPDSQFTKDPWVWQGWVPDGPIERCAPKNMAWKRSMFDGPGGLADPEATLESFLANEVEGPAALAIRDFCGRPSGMCANLPSPLMRYLAWAAARSLPMQSLETFWAEQGFGCRGEVVEPPPDGLLKASTRVRDVAMRHPAGGSQTFTAGSDFEKLASEGWIPDMSERSNFLEGIHIQAYYFQSRFFPRLKWFTLRPPEGEFFIIADRAVGWAADGYVNAPPNFLREPSAYVLAPISKTLVLLGRHSTDPWRITPAEVNAVTALFAHVWIAGPTKDVVEAALNARRMAV